MDQITQTQYDNLTAKDGAVRSEALTYILAATEHPVDWIYEVWDELIAWLQSKNSHQRAIAAQLLANLAQYDGEKRILTDFDSLFAVTSDEKFVTARHCLQSVWKVALAGPEQQTLVVNALAQHYRQCIAHKNYTLIRYDILVGLREIYDALQDESIRQLAQSLIEIEEDDKYRKKYASSWKEK